MILKEYLSSLDDEEFVYIGAKSGSGWLFIEPAGMLKNSYEAMRLYLLERAKTQVESLVKTNLKHASSIKDCYEQIRTVSPGRAEILREMISLKEDSIKMNMKRISRLRNIIKSGYDISGREVLETYPHEHKKPGTAIIISGFENGELWYYREVDIWGK